MATFNAFAQFSGYYAPNTWTLTNNPSGTGGSFSSANAPTSVDITSGNNNIQGRTSFSRAIPAAGTVSFNWSYTTTDGAEYDWPEYSINGGTPILMTGFDNSSSGAAFQTGSASITVNAGDVLAIIMYTDDGTAGAATTTFSNFTAPAASCLPPSATFTSIPNCASNQYSVDVNISSLGSATSLNVMVGTTSYGTVTTPGQVTAGPFTSGTSNMVTIVHNVDPNCNLTSTQSYTCPAINDDCINATTLNVSSTTTCTTSVNANNIGTTISSQTAPTCAFAPTTNDVWFSFVATDPNVKIDITGVTPVNTGNAYNYVGLSVYDGASGCTGLTELSCEEYNSWNDFGQGNNPMIVTGLTVNNTYYVRVWSSDYDIDPEVSFSICLTTPPPPPANNNCSNAIAVTMSPGTCSGPTTPANTASATMDNPAPPYSCWSSSNDDDIWYTFTTPPGATDAIINVTNYTYTGSSDPGIGFGLFASCTGPTDLSNGCQFYPNGTTGSYTFTGLTPGTTYYLALLTPGTGVSVAFDFCLAYTTCPAPTSLNASNVTTTTADLGWTEPGSATNWELEYGTSPLTLGTGQRSMITTNPLSVSQLIQNTSYEFYVRSVCGPADTSVWSGPYGFTTLPTCPWPTSTNTSNIGTNSADLDWIEGGTATLWQVEYGPSPLTAGTGTIVYASGTPNYSILSGLTPATTYEFNVRAVCGPADTSVITSGTFTTLCVPYTTLPWTENFDALTSVGSTDFPPCWLKENGAWETATANSYNTSFSGPNHLRDNWSAVNEYMWTPGFDLIANTSYDFSFYVAGDGATTWILDVFSNMTQSSSGSTQVGATYIPPGSGPITIQPYQKQIYTFVPGSTGTYYFGLRVNETSGSPWYIAFDDFRLEVTPTCPAPTNIAVTNPTASSLDVSWTSTATQYQIEYAQGTGFTPGTGTRVGPAGITNPATISGLTQGMPYTFYVRNICSVGDTSSWSNPVTAFTSFPAIPSNDDCSTPVNISNGALYYGSNSGATQTLAACDPNTLTATDVWYSFTTGSVAGTVIDSVNTSFSGGDVVIEMYSGTCGSLTSLTPTASSGTWGPPCIDGTGSGLEWGAYNLAANTTYFIRVYAFDNTTPGPFSIKVSGAPLAVKLDKFTAANIGASNRIEWNTLSEERSDKFELERSGDGRHFSRIYEVAANGTPSRYTYSDTDPLKGTNHYRLRMVAANGDVSFSETVTAFVKSNGFEVAAFPNPVSHELAVKVNGIQGADATIQITDVTGKLIREVKMNGTVEHVNMNDLANGIYLIKYSDAIHTRTIRVNKQ